MNPFELHIPTKLYFGNKKADSFFGELAKYGSKVLLVIGGGSVKKLGYLDKVTKKLEESDLEITLFEGIEPNPHAQTIDKAAALGKEKGVQFVLALGGGSVMDASKAIAGLIHDDETEIWPFVLGEPKYKKMKGALPVAAIPTTAATASEVTAHAIISNPDVNGKAPLSYSFMKPVASWLNPAFHTSIPLTTTRDGASDIISHAIENYLLGGSDSPLADRYSEGVMETVIQTLPELEDDLENEDLRGRLIWASTLALNGIQTAGRKSAPFTLHNLEHSLSGYNHDLAHGRGLAILYPAYFRWLWENDRVRDRLALLGNRLFGIEHKNVGEASMAFIATFEAWLQDNGLYQSLSSAGIPPEVFGEVADYAIKTYGGGKELSAAGSISKEQIVEIFELTENQTSDFEGKKTLRA